MLTSDTSVNSAIVKSGIGLGGVSYSFFGLPFSDLAAILTSVFMLISIVLTFPKLYEMYKKWQELRNESKDSCDSN